MTQNEFTNTYLVTLQSITRKQIRFDIGSLGGVWDNELEISHVATHISSLLHLHMRIQEISADVPIDVVIIVIIDVVMMVIIVVAIIVIIVVTISVIIFVAISVIIVGRDINGRLLLSI
jgi:hypothetical protein